MKRLSVLFRGVDLKPCIKLKDFLELTIAISTFLDSTVITWCWLQSILFASKLCWISANLKNFPVKIYDISLINSAIEIIAVLGRSHAC